MSSTPPDATAGPRHRRGTGKRWVVVTLVVVLLTVLGLGVVATWRLQSNLDTSPLDLGDEGGGTARQDGGTQDGGTGEAGPLDILVMGTDTRDGEGNERYGDDEDSSGAGLTDVMMLVHVSGDRNDITVVSLPRDLVADIPRCTDPESGRVHPPERGAMLNSAIENGGPGCTVATVNAMTGLKIDHFMLADFDAVKELSSAVGGVDVCVNQAVDDPKSGLELPAGVSSVEGEQALAFLRSRAAFGDGGDRSRIRSQQSFLASLARKVKEEGTLADLPKLYRIADVATRNLHVDDDLASVPTMVGIATDVRGVDLGSMAFVTVPTEPYELDPNRLQLEEDAAEDLFEKLREDRPLTAATGSATPGPSGSPGSRSAGPDATPGPGSTVDPAAVPLTVSNASGAEDRDAEVAELLEDAGWFPVEGGPQAAELPGTQVFFGTGSYDAAVRIAELLGVPSSQIVPTTSVTGVLVSVGQDFQEGVRLDVGSRLPEGLNGQTAEQYTCQEAAGDW